MPTQNNGTAPPKEAVIQYYYDDNNNFSDQFHSTLPPSYEQSTNPQYLSSSPNLNELNAAIKNNDGNSSNSAYPINKNDNIGPSSSPITNSLLNSPVPSAPPVELLDNESPSLALPPPAANPNSRTNAFPNSHPNSNPNSHNSHPDSNNPVDQTKQNGSFDCTINSLCSFLSPFKDKRNWFALFYLLFWDLDFAIFSFMWVVLSFCISVPMMVIPPIGFKLLAWSVYSWRGLAHIDILSFDAVSQKLPPSCSPPPVYIERKPGQGCFGYIFQILTDKFTVRCVVYFIFVKPWVSLFATIACVMSILFGVNFLLLPIFMPMYKDIVNFESKLEKEVLGLKDNNMIDENWNGGREMVITV